MKNVKTVVGEAELWLGDCRQILPLTRPATLVVTDPPYLLTSGGNTTAEMQGCFSKENYDNTGKIVECDIGWPEIMQLLYNHLAGSHAYVMANNRNVQAMLNAAEEVGFGFHNLLVWDKITATPNRWYMKNCEFTGFFYKGKARYINDCACKQLIRCPQSDESSHPTEKPIALMAHYIRNSTKDGYGDVVLDPFMGSGSTGIAAMQLGRRFVGIEKNEKYYRQAVERISAHAAILPAML